jgi:arylformamidase
MSTTLTREQRDDAYNNSKAVANSAEIIEAWGRRSQEFRAAHATHLDLSYGSGVRQSYDYFSAGDQSPVVAFIHGGFWQNRAKTDFTFIVPAFLEAGISVAMMGYTLAPEAKMDQIVQDIRLGLRAVSQKIAARRASNPGIWLSGWSAGGHLTAMALDEPCVIGGTAISGIYDIEPMRHCYLNDKLGLDEATALRFSPIKLPTTVGKVLDLFVGEAELPAMQTQTIEFAAYRANSKAPGVFENLSGLNHYTILDEMAQAKGRILQSIKSHF